MSLNPVYGEVYSIQHPNLFDMITIDKNWLLGIKMNIGDYQTFKLGTNVHNLYPKMSVK